MSVLFRVYQNNNKKSAYKGKWYARAVMTKTVETAELAERIERNCTVKRSDVVAVLTELIEVMRDELQASHAVKLNGFGIFRVGLTTAPANEPKNFNVTENIKGYHLNFCPEMTGGGTKGSHRKRAFLHGITAQLSPEHKVEKTKTPAQPGEHA